MHNKYKAGDVIGDYVLIQFVNGSQWVNFKTAGVLAEGYTPHDIETDVTPKKLPDRVYVTRFVRPFVKKENGCGDIDNLRGVTIYAELDYKRKNITFNYAVCDGENFNKVFGTQLAGANYYGGAGNITIPMIDGKISEDGLTYDIWRLAKDKLVPRARKIFRDAYYA